MNRFVQIYKELKEEQNRPKVRKVAMSAAQSYPAYRRLGTRPWSRAWSSPAVDWCLVKHNMVRICVEEEGDVWTAADHITKRREDEAAMFPEIKKYWKIGVGFSDAQADEQARISANINHAEHETRGPWSAAFISWVVRDAGVQANQGFVFSSAHITYIVGALRNRESGDQTRPFWLYGIDEQDEATPAPGDILCFNRGRSNHSYATLRARYWSDTGTNTVVPTGISHCDIITSKVTRNGRTFLEAIGGNKSIPGMGSRGYTVNSTEIEVDQLGRIINPAGHRIFGIIKIIECPDFDSGR